MKSYNTLLLVLVVLATFMLTASAPGPQTSLAVQLPPALIAVIEFFILVGFTALGKFVFAKLGVDISGPLGKVAAAVSSVVIVLINYGLGLTPEKFDTLLSAFLSFLTIFLGGVGTYTIFFRKSK